MSLKGPSPEQIAEWDAKLLTRVRESLKAGKTPSLAPGSRHAGRRVTSVDADGKLGVEMMRGMEVGMPWDKLSAQDKSQLALSVLREKEPADHAMLALYLLIAGEDGEAKSHPGKAGGLADEVRSMFE